LLGLREIKIRISEILPVIEEIMGIVTEQQEILEKVGKNKEACASLSGTDKELYESYEDALGYFLTIQSEVTQTYERAQRIMMIQEI
jgi:hypothetical protein